MDFFKGGMIRAKTMSTQVQRIFSQIAPTYDLLNHLLSFQVDHSWRKKAIKDLKSDPAKPLIALDLCAGTLDLSIAFLKKYKKSKVVACDFAQPMLVRGLPKIKGLESQIQCICADALKLPFANASFDVVFCGYGFRNISDKEAALIEMRRILKPGGELLILDFFKPTNLFSKVFHDTYGKCIMPCLGGMISKSKEAYRYLHDSIQGFYSLEECQKHLEQKGYVSVQTRDFWKGISSYVIGRNP